MPLLIDGGVPPRWLERKGSRSFESSSYQKCLKIGLINNMPDAALEDTEMQFLELLDAASGHAHILLRLFSLPGVIRSERGRDHLGQFYSSTNELCNSHLDAVIVTGTEPQHSNLRQEPYWDSLVDVLEWAERNTTSTILSCLAAHAGVLASDGIPRHRLPDKHFGVFQFTKPSASELTANTSDIIRFPHSRWNEVRAEELVECGYTVLTESANAGVDAFTKKKKKSLFVHFQGHPEYGEQTLLKEYRRDIKRFLRRERETYPTMPQGYFGPEATEILTAFRERATANPSEEIINAFPEVVLDTLQNRWHSSALSIYGNWLRYIDSRKTGLSAFPVVAELASPWRRKRAALR